jgi:TPR repeat protein
LHAGNYTEASRFLLPQAQQGNARAQLLVADMYRNGWGVEPDRYQAFLWYRKAAEQGVAEAQFRVGLFYLRGDTVTGNEYRAMDWLGAAAKQGHVQAELVYDRVLNTEPGVGC